MKVVGYTFAIRLTHNKKLKYIFSMLLKHFELNLFT
jgi:hypothetical protein